MTAGPTRVLMLVENDVVIDTRVQKEALALACAGLDVTLLGVAPGHERLDEQLGPCRLVRVPVGTAAADRAGARRARLRALTARSAPRPEHVAELRAAMAERRRQLAAASREAASHRPEGPAGAVVYKAGVAGRWVRRELLRVRGRALTVQHRSRRRLHDVQQKVWRELDRRHAASTDRAAWRRDLPEVHDFVRAVAPVVDELAPDVLHAHDVRTTIVAAHAVERARAQGRELPWVYDAHEYVAGLSLYGPRTPRVVAAWTTLEAEFVRSADRVITVSPEIAVELQQRYTLPRRPAVVLNIPRDAEAGAGSGPRLRDMIGLAEDIPLLVYSGKVTAARGVQTAVEALVSMPDTHLAVVAVPNARDHRVTALAKLAARRGVTDRLHLVDPVPPSQVVGLLSSATAGLIPLLHFGSHEMALTNKLFEYLHARIPVLVSDCRAQARFVRDAGVGEVFTAEDADSLAQAATAVVKDRAAYVASITDDLLAEYSWARQEEHLRDLYRDLLGAPALRAEDDLAPLPDGAMVPTAGTA